MPNKVLVALQPQLLEQIDYIAKVESRTRSDLIREALRRYIGEFRKNTAITAAYTATQIVEPIPIKVAAPAPQLAPKKETTAFLGY
jgi:metal-responsive CopG/Arc/MetJ family transcriptional regulator